jgi:4'-phosphopantetheinyl transferase
MTNWNSVWRDPPEHLELAGDAVHVWRGALDLEAEQIGRYWNSLSQDEKERADRFRFEQDRSRFIVAHGVLRGILGRYLGLEPAALRFQRRPNGKPELRPEFGGGLRFNLAHSQGLALYAVTRDREVGVDLEYVRVDVARERIAEQFFSLGEVAVLRALPEADQMEAFFNCWTRKEAYVKARGDGLSLPLDLFDVSMAPGEPAVLLSTRDDPAEASRWLLREISPGPGYKAAVAVEGGFIELKLWQWPAAAVA